MDDLKKLTCYPHPLGSQIDVIWEFPDEMPDNATKVFLFKRSVSNVTDEEIANYFANIDDLEGYNYNGLFVFDRLPEGLTGMVDYQVRNGIPHYYKAVIRDEVTSELSNIISANATPEMSIITHVEDGKEIAVRAIEKMFASLKDKKGNQINLGKDVEVKKQFSITAVENDQVMIERINGSTQYNYWGNTYAQQGQGAALSEMDSDVIRATFFTIGSPDRRDQMTNILRSRKLWLQLMCKRLGAKDVRITVEGDYWNPQFHGATALGVTMIFAFLIENKMKITYEEIDSHITEDDNFYGN